MFLIDVLWSKFWNILYRWLQSSPQVLDCMAETELFIFKKSRQSRKRRFYTLEDTSWERFVNFLALSIKFNIY